MVKIGDVLVCGVHFVKSNDPNQARSENPFDPSIFIFNTLTITLNQKGVRGHRIYLGFSCE